MNESPTLLRRQLGRFLRECREATGMTIALAAGEAQISATGLQRLEAGHSKNSPHAGCPGSVHAL